MNNAALQLLINEKGAEYFRENDSWQKRRKILIIKQCGHSQWHRKMCWLQWSFQTLCVTQILGTKTNTEPDAYKDFMATHDCSINNTWSSGSVEVTWLVDCFKSSIQNYGLCYTHFIGMVIPSPIRDTSQWSITVQILECVGHFQKRAHAWLRKLKSENKCNSLMLNY